MVKKNYFLLFFFIFLSIFSLTKLFDNSTNLDAWEYGEWLINYQYGFVRRGLFGEIIYQLSSVLNNNIQISFFLILSIICLFYYFLNYLFLKNIKFNFFNFFIIFSPLFYLFFVMINGVGVRKEIILYIFYLLYLISLCSKDFDLKKAWKFIYFFPLLLFIHEGIFFYLPYVFFPLLFLIRKENYKNLLFHLFTSTTLSFAIMMFLFFNKGTNAHVIHICQSLGIFAPINCEKFGPIYALKDEILRDQNYESLLFFYLEANCKSWLGYTIYILYSLLPFSLFFYFTRLKNNIFKSKYPFLLIYLIFFGFSLPLFHLTQDWSRWFSIHFHLIAFLIFFLQRIEVLHYEKKEFLYNLNSFFANRKIFFFFFLLIYSTLLHHEEYFSKGVKLEFTYYNIFKKLK